MMMATYNGWFKKVTPLSTNVNSVKQIAQHQILTVRTYMVTWIKIHTQEFLSG